MILASQRMHEHSDDVAILVTCEDVRDYPTDAALVFNLAGQPGTCASTGDCDDCVFFEFCGTARPSVIHMFTSLSRTHPELLI